MTSKVEAKYFAIQLLDDPHGRYPVGCYLYEQFYEDGYGGAKMMGYWSDTPELYKVGKDLDHMLKRADGYGGIKYRIVPFKGVKGGVKVVKTRGYK